MKAKIKEVAIYAKEHKKEILIGTGLFVGTCVLVSFGIKNRSALKQNTIKLNNECDKLVEAFSGYTEHEMKLNIGECNGYSKKGDWVGFDIFKLKPGDLGKVGEEILRVPEIAEDTNLWAIIQVDN